MSTLVYAPGVEVIIGTDNGLIDVSEDIESGSVSIREDSPHSLNLRLINPRRKYDGVFSPNDRVVVRLKRIRWVQVFSGYLDRVPLRSSWPRNIELIATCTMKKILYRSYDEGSAAVSSLHEKFFEMSDKADGGLSARAVAMLTEIARWPEEKIHIGRLPDKWASSTAALYEKYKEILAPTPEALSAIAAMSDNNTGMIGGSSVSNIPDGSFINDNVGDPSLMGPSTVTAQEAAAYCNRTRPNGPGVKATWLELANLYISMGNAEGVRGDLIFCQSLFETGWYTNNGSVKYNNFSGIGHGDHMTADQASKFSSISNGVKAHIQLIKKVVMGNDAPMALPKTDRPRWLGRTGAKTLSDLFKVGYHTTPNYHERVLPIFRGMLQSAGKTMSGAPKKNTSLPNLDALNSSIGAKKKNTSLPNVDALNATIGASKKSGSISSAQFVFPVPGGNLSGSGFGPRKAPTAGASTFHKGQDIGASQGTPILAPRDMKITRAGTAGGYGNAVFGSDLQFPNVTYEFGHIMNGGILVSSGQTVRAGQQIAKVGSTGVSTGPHLHFTMKINGVAVDPKPYLQGSARVDGSGPPGGGEHQMGDGSSMFSASGYKQAVDITSTYLTGHRALMNDTPLLPAVKSFINASMRSFCSAPNGDLIAWYPDYFDRHDISAKMVLEDIELIDFTIDWDDRHLVTHQFVIGSVHGMFIPSPEADTIKMINTMGVATAEMEELLEDLIGSPMSIKEVLDRMGPRPSTERMPAVTDPRAEFYFAIHLFCKAWAQQFSNTIQVSFMPEIWPGMLLMVPSQDVQVYVQGVTHSWDFAGGGFTTTVDVCAPSTIRGTVEGLPKAGALG